MRTLNNARACLSWLNYLNTEQQATALFGTITPELKTAAELYSIPNYNISYGAEVRLLGEAGVDLSVQYYGTDFAYNNPLENTQLEAAGSKFHNYAKALNENYPNLLSRCRFYLESDTASGNSEDYALFYSIAGSAADTLLPSLLVDNNTSEVEEVVLEFRATVKPQLELWLVGFMNSREKKPLRLVFVNPQNSIDQFIMGIKKLYPELPSDFEDKLHTVANLNIFNFMLNIDVMPDGSLGNTIGIDLLFETLLPTNQQKLLSSSECKKFISLLNEWEIADSRVDLVPNCVQLLNIDTQKETYQLLSALSHFKLRWQENKLLPAKAYIWLKFDK